MTFARKRSNDISWIADGNAKYSVLGYARAAISSKRTEGMYVVCSICKKAKVIEGLTGIVAISMTNRRFTGHLLNKISLFKRRLYNDMYFIQIQLARL
jgi:hypothetical protein